MILILDTALFFANHTFHILYFIVGLLAIDRNKFIHILCVTMFASVLNVLLKQYFAIPLHPSIGKIGFSYPSGHTNFNVVLWGATFLVFRKWQILLFPAIIFPLSYMGMLHYNYHSEIDIAAGIAEGLIILIGFYYSLKFFDKNYQNFLLILYLTTWGLIYFISITNLKSWIFMHMGAFSAGLLICLFNIRPIQQSLYQKIACIILAIPLFSYVEGLRKSGILLNWTLITLVSTVFCLFIIVITPIITRHLFSCVSRIRQDP